MGLLLAWYSIALSGRPGAPPSQLENEVARPIEDAVASIAGLNHVTSRISDGAVTMVVEFDSDPDFELASQFGRRIDRAILFSHLTKQTLHVQVR